MSNNANKPGFGLDNALVEISKRLKDPFLRLMLGLVIVLGIIAIARTNLQVTIVVALAGVVLFIVYLIYLWLINVNSWKYSVKKTEQIMREVAQQMTNAINRDQYISGIQTKQDFGASMVRAIRKAVVEDDYKESIEGMAQKFKDAFGVPDSML